MKTKGLYIHIPFCDAICVYCDFVKMVRSDDTKHSYMKQLLRHLDAVDFTDVDTVYIGGGTPTSVALSDLLDVLHRLPRVKEVTLEANPEHINETLLDALEPTSVTRLSLGVQTFRDDILKALNRTHTAAQARRAIKLIQARRFRLSIDLIYNLPNQTLEDVQEDANELDGIEHVSWYSLILEPNTMHYVKYLRGEYVPNTKDDVMMETIMTTMTSLGFRQYEVSNYTRGDVSHHNMHYWLADDVAAIGLGATGTANGMRYQITRDLQTFLTAQTPVATREPRDHMNEVIMVGFRLLEGIDKARFASLFGQTIAEAYPNVAAVIAQGLVEETPTHVRPTQKGIMLNNEILIQLL
jgi:oxygen-independent coproporphyrinogen III oxidase